MMSLFEDSLHAMDHYKRKMPADNHKVDSSSRMNKIPLPSHFKVLLDLFVSLDFAVNKLISSHQSLYLNRITEVMKGMNHDFNETIFRQILNVLPESYFYEFNSTPIKIAKYIREQLKLIPNLSFGPEVDCSPRKSERCLSVAQITFRKQQMQERLFKIVKLKHDLFLEKIGDIDSKHLGNSIKFRKWHSEFDLENCVEEIQPASLDRNFKYPINQTIKIPDTRKVFRNIFKVPTNSGNIISKDQLNMLIGHTNFIQNNRNINATSRKLSSTYREHSLKQKLPFHLKALFELFIKLDKVVHDIYCKGELCYLSRIVSALSVNSPFSESHLGKIMTLYHGAYFIKWERLPSSNTVKPTKKIDITIKPNLRNDNTKSALMSPDKGFLKFDFVQLKERRLMFLEKCIDHVDFNYRRFLLNKCIPPELINSYLQNDSWHHEFNIDLHVELVDPTPMPNIPEETDDFKELTSFSQMYKIMKKKNVFDCGSKICFRYSTNSAKSNSKALPQSMIDKVNENKVKKLASNLHGKDGNNNVAMVSKLKDLVVLLDTEFKTAQYKPLPLSYISNIAFDTLGVNDNSFIDYLYYIMELVPGWIAHLSWGSPHLSIDKSNLSIDDVSAILDSSLGNSISTNIDS